MKRPTTVETKTRGLTSFALHIIAMALMLCDHLWGTFLPRCELLSYLGRIAFPLFAFMLVEGFFHTGSRKKYALRLLLFALISELPFNLMVGHSLWYPLHQNILWSLLLGMAMLLCFERIRRGRYLLLRLAAYGAILLVFYVLAILAFVDYYGASVLTIALFYFTALPQTAALPKKLLAGAVQLAGIWWISSEIIAGMVLSFSVFGMTLEFHKQCFALLALPLIWLYNGQQGHHSKAFRSFCYWFYPAHLAVLGALITLL